jgi:MSHA biogenesis protein MshJ
MKQNSQQKVNTVQEDQLSNKIVELTKSNILLNQEIASETRAMVSPKEMVTILKRIIESKQNIRLIGLESLETKPMFSGDADHGPPIFIHGLSIECEGEYFDLLDFLQVIEKTEPRLLWEKIEYAVGVHPKSHIHIIVQTLSLESGWMEI